MHNNDPTSSSGIKTKNFFFYCNLTVTRMEAMEKIERMDKNNRTYGVK
jgi:hypothetical protein